MVSYSNWNIFGVGGSVLSICRVPLQFNYRRQRVVVDGATSERIPIVSGVDQGSVLGPLLFILVTSEIFEQVENWLYANTDDSTLLAVVRSLLPTLIIGTWLGFRVAAITGAWYGILTKPRLWKLVDPGLWTIPMVTWLCLKFQSNDLEPMTN